MLTFRSQSPPAGLLLQTRTGSDHLPYHTLSRPATGSSGMFPCFLSSQFYFQVPTFPPPSGLLCTWHILNCKHKIHLELRVLVPEPQPDLSFLGELWLGQKYAHTCERFWPILPLNNILGNKCNCKYISSVSYRGGNAGLMQRGCTYFTAILITRDCGYPDWTTDLLSMWMNISERTTNSRCFFSF
jgi:hypothetical protein